ncbi:MAG: LysR family transcriptional regulator [Pseudomonadota bacterium]
MERWTEIYTAYCVARVGTISKAAEELGVHRATVSRHIDALEEAIGTRLFLRHRRGYTLTDSGREFLQVADRAYQVLEDFFGRVRVRGDEVAGEIIVTTLFPLTTMIHTGILEFRRRHPRTRVSVQTGDELLRLEKAEAHVALRVGAKPNHPDYVVQKYTNLDFALFAHRSYVDRHGRLEGLNFAGHALVGNPDAKSPAPFEAWLAENVDPNLVVLTSPHPKVIEDAVCSGAGMGFLPVSIARYLTNLEQVSPALPEWRVRSWLVTHVDLHRTEKVQSMLACLKAVAPQNAPFRQAVAPPS